MASTLPADLDVNLVLRWIDKFNQKKGYSPSTRELCEAFGWKSPSTGHAVLQECMRRGRLEVVAPQRRKLLVKADR